MIVIRLKRVSYLNTSLTMQCIHLCCSFTTPIHKITWLTTHEPKILPHVLCPSLPHLLCPSFQPFTECSFCSWVKYKLLHVIQYVLYFFRTFCLVEFKFIIFLDKRNYRTQWVLYFNICICPNKIQNIRNTWWVLIWG